VTVALTWPAEPIVIVPPHPHEQVEESSSAASPSTVTLDEPGVQGLSSGWHGCGVSTPLALAVALATVGLDIDVHIPKDATFAAPTSSIVPTATWLAETSGLDALNVAGVVPNEHCRLAPVQTRFDTASSLSHQR
jgi:hypothetical protein